MDSPAERIGTVLLVAAVGALASTALTYAYVQKSLTSAYNEALAASPELNTKLAGTTVEFTAQEATVTLADDAHRGIVQPVLDTLPITATHFKTAP